MHAVEIMSRQRSPYTYVYYTLQLYLFLTSSFYMHIYSSLSIHCAWWFIVVVHADCTHAKSSCSVIIINKECLGIIIIVDVVQIHLLAYHTSSITVVQTIIIHVKPSYRTKESLGITAAWFSCLTSSIYHWSKLSIQ